MLQQLFLYFFTLQGANLALSSAKKSNKQGAAAATTPHPRAGGRAAVGGKDQSLVLFHGLGKVLYAKRASAAGPPEPCPPLPAALERHRRLPLLADPEQVLENTPIRCVFLDGRLGSSVVEPGPEKIIPDLDQGSPGSKVNSKYNYSDILIKFDNFSQMLHLTNRNSFKKILIILYIVVECNLTH